MEHALRSSDTLLDATNPQNRLMRTTSTGPAVPLRIPEHPPPVAPARGPPQTELLAHDPPSPWDTAHDPPPGREPFDQSLPGDDGT